MVEITGETGEVITLSHRWVYNPNDAPVEEVVYDQEVAAAPDPFTF